MALRPLDQWLARRMGQSAVPSRQELRVWQLDRLRETVSHARSGSPFYARHLAEVAPEAIATLDDFSCLPTIGPDHLRDAPERLLCVSRDEIARVVTLQTSGTTGPAKRVFQTADDLEATVDYFAWGMANIIAPGGTALVLMPGDRPGGVGRLLGAALARIGAHTVAHGVMENVEAALDQCLDEDAHCVVGCPAHLNMLARAWERRGLPLGRVDSVLLCWDAVPDAVARNCARIFGCRVFRHWGMIETGLGGAVECAPGSGLHLRETDVYLEIVDPSTGHLLPDGEFGEMVVTTPLKRGMPLIRYRTGDMGRVLQGDCACTSPLRRLDPLVWRTSDGVRIGERTLTLRELSECLYALPGLDDFAAWFGQGVLRIVACGDHGLSETVASALDGLPVVAQGLLSGALGLEINTQSNGAPAIAGLGKRCLNILGEEDK
jgi:phenylacetate-coenzyme A ligase PaaK-like adenylate-forming protein